MGRLITKESEKWGISLKGNQNIPYVCKLFTDVLSITSCIVLFCSTLVYELS